jgi:hypothetical protein
MPTRKEASPSKKDVDAALEKSAEFLEQQAEPPSDVHIESTTPSKKEVEAAVEKSVENLESQGVKTDSAVSDATPVSAGGTNAASAATPVDASRDKTQDASPVFESPVTSKPREE